MLLKAVEGSGPLMFAEIAICNAVNAGKPGLNRHRVGEGREMSER